MSKVEDFKKLLADHVRYEDGTEEAGKGSDELKARYHYLRHGGSWDLQTNIEESKYLAGFLDAMNVLGVKP